MGCIRVVDLARFIKPPGPLVKPLKIFRSSELGTICGGLFPKMKRGHICNLVLVFLESKFQGCTTLGKERTTLDFYAFSSVFCFCCFLANLFFCKDLICTEKTYPIPYIKTISNPHKIL